AVDPKSAKATVVPSPTPQPALSGSLTVRSASGGTIKTTEVSALPKARWSFRLRGGSTLSLADLSSDVRATATFKRDGKRRTEKLTPQEMRPDTSDKSAIRLAGVLSL